jgi:hypothetical protein
VNTASSIANNKGISEEKERHFWELYWGVMGMVEKEEVTQAMVAFGDELKSNRDLKNKALAIAHACRAELANDWSSSWSR